MNDEITGRLGPKLATVLQFIEQILSLLAPPPTLIFLNGGSLAHFSLNKERVPSRGPLLLFSPHLWQSHSRAQNPHLQGNTLLRDSGNLGCK